MVVGLVVVIVYHSAATRSSFVLDVAARQASGGVGTIWEIIFKLNLTSSRGTRRMRSGIFINYLFILSVAC